MPEVNILLQSGLHNAHLLCLCAAEGGERLLEAGGTLGSGSGWTFMGTLLFLVGMKEPLGQGGIRVIKSGLHP